MLYYITYIFINSNLFVLHSSHTMTLSKGTIFAKKYADISKMKSVVVLKGIFSETTDVCVHTTIF